MHTLCLNPFYIMETILMDYEEHVKKAGLESLNPFYIMETILIEKWYPVATTDFETRDSLNPFYIMETILIRKLRPSIVTELGLS